MANVTPKIHRVAGLAIRQVLALVVLLAIVVLYFQHSLSKGSIESVAHNALDAIHSGNLQAAYDLTSTTFRQQTKPDTFNSFIGQYPILQQDTKVNFSQRQVEKNNAALGGILTGENGRQMQIQFQFVKENDVWRIQGINIAPLNNTEPTIQADHSGATIKGILISNQADKDGYVTKAENTIDKLSAKIYVTVQITAPKAGGQIETSMTQLSNSQKFGPSVDNLTTTGNLLKAFAFTKVTNTWDPGDYEVTVKLSSGDTKTLKFAVK